MKCSHPLSVVDKSTAGRMLVPCGRCIPCRLNYSSMWGQRLMHEKMFHDKSVFVTMTYREEDIPKGKFYRFVKREPKNLSVGGTLCKRDVQLFLKRLRKAVSPRKIRFFVGGEYGERDQRPHYHGIIYGLDCGDAQTIETAWGKGFVSVGSVTDDSCNYVGKYVVKKLSGPLAVEYEKRGVIPEFGLMSRGGKNGNGIGSEYAKKFKCELVNRGYTIVKGSKVLLPRYYQSKIFTDDKSNAVRERRRVEYDTNYRRERMEALRVKGYVGVDRDEKLSRQKIEDNVKGKLALKGKKL